MKQRIKRFVKNFGIALVRTVLEDSEVLPIVVLIAFAIAAFWMIGSSAYSVLAESRAEILSINPDKLFPS
jgi:hypothetical protein